MNFGDYVNTKPYATRSKDREAWEEYSAEHSLLYEKFKLDLFEELGIADNPKREKLFSIAWSNGHAYGYSEVFNCADELVELIK